MQTITIIDYGMGNLHSIAKAVEHVAVDSQVLVSASAGEILSSDRVVFPGVGGIGHCMQELKKTGLDQVVRQAAASKPLLGICLGMQALLESSEENSGTDGLGLIPGQVKYFGDKLLEPLTGHTLKVPHMGWNQVTENQHPLWQGIEQNSRFYFVHSYYAAPENKDDEAGSSVYGSEFCCAIARENIFAVQFHPEKSQWAGLQLLKNFTTWDGRG